MQPPHGLYDPQFLAGGCVATIDNFDGVHLGHRAILARLRERPLELGVSSCAVIFEPQSYEFFPPGSAPVCLTRLRKKLELLHGQGVDVVLCLALNCRLRELSAAEFIHQVLVNGLAMQHLGVDDGLRFGCDRSGGFAFLVNVSREQGFTVEATTIIELDGVRVSSTRIRQVLVEGDLHLAKCLLGHPFSLSGWVPHGQKLDRQLGSPVVNVQPKRRKAPLNGIHLVNTLVDGQRCRGVVSVGTRPSVNGDGRSHPEMYLLDFIGDLYGRHLQVTFHQKLRNEQRFASLEVPKAAILADITAARAYWLGQPLS